MFYSVQISTISVDIDLDKYFMVCVRLINLLKAIIWSGKFIKWLS